MATQTDETTIIRRATPSRKQVPASEERERLERDVLTAMISGMARDQFLLGDLLDICPADYFVTPFARPLAEALDLLRKSGASQDIVTLATQMHARHALDTNRYPYPDMAWIGDAACSTFGIREYAETFARSLANEHRRSLFYSELLNVASEANIFGTELCEVADHTRKIVEQSFDSYTHAAGIDSVLTRIRQKLDTPQALQRIALPWSGLNRILRGGFLPGELVVLAARPGIGKTAFAVNIALSAAKSGKGVFFVSCEMSDESLACRMISLEGRIDGRFFREGLEATDQIREPINQAMQRISALPITIAERSTVPMCPREVRRLARGTANTSLVIIDYLQLLHPDQHDVSREREVAEMSRAFKQLAMDLRVPVLLLSQLNRSSEERNREPKVSDLRESGAIEQDADIIFLLHTKASERSQSAPQVKCIVGKSRSTGTGAVWLQFRKEFSMFEDAPYRTETKQNYDIVEDEI